MFQFGAWAGYLAGVLDFASFAMYIYAMFKLGTRPNRASWWIWSLSALIIATSYHFTGAEQTIWMAISEFAGLLVVSILSIKWGVGGWSRSDRFSLAGASLSLILWAVSGSAFLTLVFILAVDFFGAFPTILKSYKDPKSENITSWGLVFWASVINIFAAEEMTIEILIYPLYMTFILGLIYFLLIYRTRKLKAVKEVEGADKEIDVSW